MIEIIVVILILMAVVGSLRQPRTFAEAEYRSHVRRERQRFAWLLFLISALFTCIYFLILAIASIP